MFIQLNEATNHTVHVSNHGALSTLSEALKGGFIITFCATDGYKATKSLAIYLSCY